MTGDNGDGCSDTSQRMLDAIARLEQKVDALSADVAGIRKETGALLYATVLEKMRPGLIEQVLPKLDDPWFDGPRSLIGAAGIHALSTLCEYSGRTLTGMGLFLCSFPADKALALMREAEEVVPGGYKAVSAGYVLHFLRRRFHYTPEHLLPECVEFQRRYNDWRPELKHIWGICIETYALVGDERGATELLERYRVHYNYDKLGDIPLAARFARDRGVDDEYILASAELADEVEGNNEHGVPEALMQGSVAVVGGGPQEVGLGLGGEIDAHDTVIRVNHVPHDETVFRDYGSKVDILATVLPHDGRSLPLPDPRDLGRRLKALMFPNSLRQRYLSRRAVQEIMRYKRDTGVSIIMPSDKLQPTRGCYQSNDIYSSGLSILIWVKLLKPEFSAQHMYGFMHKYPYTSEYGYYGHASRRNQVYSAHDMMAEKEIFDQMFTEKPACGGRD